MSDFLANLSSKPQVQNQNLEQDIEVGGVVAEATPSPLFTVAPASASESSSSGSSSGGTNYVC